MFFFFVCGTVTNGNYSSFVLFMVALWLSKMLLHFGCEACLWVFPTENSFSS